MEDFTKQELRPLIYRERTDIEDFDIDNPKSLDAVMYDRITSSKIVEFEGAPEYILDIFNNAYYITTLILMEKRPILYQSRYFLIAEHTSSAYEDINEKNNFYRYFESMIMAMVCNYLRVLRPDIYTDMQKSKMLNAIWSYHDSNNVIFGRNTEGRSLFYHNILHPTELKKYSVNKNDFKPLHTAKELMAMEIQDLEDVGNANNSKSVNNDLQIEEVEELKAKVEYLEEQLAEMEKKKKGISPGINQAQAALFGLSLANAFDFKYSNMKKDLAPVIHKLFGWGKSKIAYYLSTPCEKEEKEELANLFKDLCPHLYDVIMNKGRLPFGVTPKVTPHDEKVTPSKE